MTSTRETDYVHANERGNGPKARMEGGDATDDISINDPDSRLKEMRKIKADEVTLMEESQKIAPQ